MIYKNDRAKWIGGLLCVILLYSLFYVLFADRAYTYNIPRKIRHVIKFGTTVAVYLVGTYHLGQLKDKWMSTLWHFIHISLLCTITAIGIIDWTFGMVNIKTKEIAASMQEFLISPVLYFAMGLVNQRYKSEK
ncbi:MAG: hypothetical protein FJX92_02370 [Bacteroidetes bacterium]|nr:hypothetical protein [Bacteroidota bacterium]